MVQVLIFEVKSEQKGTSDVFTSSTALGKMLLLYSPAKMSRER